jgi:hypothetical protein
MTKKELLITLFGAAPDVWTADQLQELENITGETITHAELCAAHMIEKSPNARHIAAAISENMEKLHGADFATRCDVLRRELLPALEFQEAQRARCAAPFISVSGGAAEAAGDVDGIDGSTGGAEA